MTDAFFNLEAEQAVLGALLMNNDCLAKVAELSASHFFEPVHGRIFAAIGKLYSDGMAATPVSLKTALTADNALESVGGIAYLARLCGSAVTIINIDVYAKIVVDMAVKRRLREIVQQTIDELETESDTAPEMLASGLMANLQGIFDESRRESTTDRAALVELVESFKEDVEVTQTGIAPLDHAMGGGLYPGRMYGIGGRKKYGKSLLSAQLAWNVAQSGKKALFVCAEMGEREIMERLIAWQIGENPIAFRTKRRLDPTFQQKVLGVLPKLRENLSFYYDPSLSFESLKRVLLLNFMRTKFDGFFLDYWQLVGGAKPRQSEREHLDNVAQWLAGFCKKHKVWGVVMAQINQDGNTRGGEGMRLACDQFYRLERRLIEGSDTPASEAWLDMLETRYTPWLNVGCETRPALVVSEHGTHFVEIA